MSSLASQLSSRRLARAEARQSHNELKLTVLNLLETDERFAPRLRAFVEDFQRTVAAVELPEEEVEAVAQEERAAVAIKQEDEATAEQQRLAALAEAAGAAVVTMPQLEQDTSEKNAWSEYDGALLEAELRVDDELGASPVRLIDARYIIQLEQLGGTFIRRQDLPETAFLSLESIKRLPKGGNSGDCLRIISVSHPWQHPDHPDPKSINLKLLVRVLTAFVDHMGGTYGVFLDVRLPLALQNAHRCPQSLLMHQGSPTCLNSCPVFDAVCVAHPEGAQGRGAL